MRLSNIYILIFVLIAFVLPVSCADIETETSGYATMKINLDDVSHRKAARSRFATETMTTSDAKTILAVLVPSIPCESRTATTGLEYSRSLVDITTQSAQFVVPLDTNIKLCLYFFRGEYKLNDLTGGAITPDGFGQSGIFTIDSETNSKTVSVEFWAISFSDVTFKISSSSSAGMVAGSSGSAKLNSAAGYIIEAKDFTITSDNGSTNVETKSVEFTNVAYDTYSYNIELQGFIPSNEAFNVNSPSELLDIKLEPNLVEIEWFSFDNLTISQVGSSPYAVAGGTVVLNVPNEHKDNITQVISIMQVNHKKYSVTGDLIQLGDGFTSSANEVQVWATDNREVGDGTYLVYVEDVSELDVQNFKLVLTGPGITDNITYGPYDFKDDDNASTTEAVNPQAVFFIQVQNNSIVRSDKINVGDNLSSTLLQWTGPLQNSVVE